jgi:two-component system, NtrC family, response regulator AtoC
VEHRELKTKKQILVVDSDWSTRKHVSSFLIGCNYQVVALASGDETVAYLKAGNTPDLILLDVTMPGISGLEALTISKKINESILVIMLSACNQIRTVVEAMRLGASDYLTKPFDDPELVLAIENALRKRSAEDKTQNQDEKSDPYEDSMDILSSNATMLRIKEIGRRVADQDVPILILGESGVGKEVVARYIHAQSKRRSEPFIKINCAALPRDLLESELFGYDRGAFTGAHTDKPGKFELAESGSILLDEIGELDPALHAKLLHVLQDGEYTRLGGRRNIKVRARVLASTNANLEEAVARGEFRADLYFRLNVIRLEIPPLRERPEDIPLYCNYIIEKYRDRYNSKVTQLPRDLMLAFSKYYWPGNVRELENHIKRHLILGDLDQAPLEFDSQPPSEANNREELVSLKALAANAAEHAEREAVLKALEQTQWNRKKAATVLGICYKALLNKLKKWQLDNRPRNVSVDPQENAQNPASSGSCLSPSSMNSAIAIPLTGTRLPPRKHQPAGLSQSRFV